MDALEVLMEEHEIILKAIGTLKLSVEAVQKGSVVPDEFYIDFTELIKVFADKCHHSKEETFLFPMVKQKEPGELASIDALYEEHEKGRQLIRGLEESLSKGDVAGKIRNAEGYAQLLGMHIKRENALFPVWISSFSDADTSYLLVKFEEIEEKIIGLGKHDEYALRVEKLKNML